MNLNPIFKHIRILIKGAGDLATGVATCLYHAGFPIAMTEMPQPALVRRTVCFGSAVYESKIQVEEITAVKSSFTELEDHLEQGYVSVLVDPNTTVLAQWSPVVLIDAIMAKVNTGIQINQAPLVIALGPGFYASRDCHLVIETNRGHNLGRIIKYGPAEPNTSIPGQVKGHTQLRVLRAPASGYLEPQVNIGDSLKQGDLIASIEGENIVAPFNGILRGLIHPSVPLTPGYKIGDLDPRCKLEHCFSISDKSLAIGGGVLQAVLNSDVIRAKMGHP